MNGIQQIPKDWKWVKLGEVCDKMSNGTNAKQTDDKIGFPISRIETIWNETIDLDRVKYIQENDAVFVEKYSLKKDDILFSHINSDIHLGKTAIYKNQTKILIHGINLLLIRLSKDAIPDFFNYQFRYKRRMGEFINIAQKSVNQSSINQPKLKNINFVLPPKSIQLAIVSKIEELFSELDKGIENMRTAQQQLKSYRQAVLKWAFVNSSLKNFVLKEVTEKIQIGPFGTQLHKEDYIENGIPLINPTHIKGGLILANNSFSILQSKRDSLPNYILKEGDVIMGRRGEMGRCGLVTKKEEGWFCGTGSLYFRPDVNKVNSVFLYYNLSSQSVKKYLDDNAGGTTMANLNLKIVNNIPISLPSIKEQNKIVQEIESRLSIADKLEENITQSLQQAEALRQSILKKAFEGTLI